MGKTKVGIIGSTGYVGLELIRLLINHKEIESLKIGSGTFLGENIVDIYPNLGYENIMICQDNYNVIKNSDIVFTCLPHGVSEEYVLEAKKYGKKVIDLGADFRIKNKLVYKKWYGVDFLDEKLHDEAVYGLTEIYEDKIKKSNIVANPGCYPTSVLLALVPLLEADLIEVEDIIIDSKSGLTGSGRSLTQSSHFIDVNENICAYNIGSHRHTPEIEQYLSLSCNKEVRIVFTPSLIPVNRGILSNIYCFKKQSLEFYKIHDKLTEYYKNKPFVEILPIGKTVSLKNSRFSNKCVISLHESKNRLVICSTVDNMIKGSAGQAIQNMNIMLGFNEVEGLKSIASFF